MGTSDSSLLKANFDGIHPVETTQSHSYVIQRAKPKPVEGQKKNSVLIFSGDKHLMENLKHFSRTIKHPSLLYYMETHSLEASLTTHIVFENAVPLVQCIKDMTAQELVHGMHNITNALLFIHDICLCSYNNVLMSSIFVADSGEWKLGCLENMSKFTNSSWQVFAQNKIPSHLLPPEDSCEAAVPTNFGFTRDVYMLGHLFKNEILNTNNYSRHNKLTLDTTLTDFVDFTSKNMLSQDYKLRPKCSSILKHSVFNSYYSSIVNFFHNFVTKDDEEKVEFLESLRSNISTLDSKLVVTRILPLLLADWVVYETTAQRVIGDILNPAISIKSPKSSRGFLTENLYKDHVVPQFLKLLYSRSIDTRLLLLSHLKPILPYIPKKEISKTLLPKLLAGLRDTNDDIVSLTFHCLGDLVPYLGSNRVVGGSRRVVFVEIRPRTQAANVLPTVDSSYFAEEETNDTDSEVDLLAEVSLSNFRKSKGKPETKNRNERQPSRGPAANQKSNDNSAENAIQNSRLNSRSVKKKALSELAERLDPISEKTEEVIPKSILKTSNRIPAAPPIEESAVVTNTESDNISVSNLETLSDLELKIIQNYSTGTNANVSENSAIELDNAESGLDQPTPVIYPELAGICDRVKVSLSDDSENDQQPERLSSTEFENDQTSKLNSSSELNDYCSNGSFVKENRVSLSEGNQISQRRLIQPSPESYTHFESSLLEQKSEVLEGSGDNGWDDLDWNSD